MSKKFQVSRAAQRDFRVLGGSRPSGSEATAREALALAKSNRQKDAIHVVPRKDGWAVKTEQRERAASVTPTKAKAVEAARVQARAQGARLIVHGSNGRILNNTKPAPKSSAKHK